MAKPAITVQSIHFEDFDGFQFERLVFAYHARTDTWRSLEWYGQVGSDLGRDIWGVRDDDTRHGEAVCIQCVNRKTMTFAKIRRDIDKLLTAPNGAPSRFRVVTRATVSADMRDKIKKYAASKRIQNCDIWSGQELEEHLRHGAESLLKRFVDGETFPDVPPDLRAFAGATDPLDDNETLCLMAKLFDRPAFYTPIQQESSLPAFKQAITDTIQALGTGTWKTRDGHVIARIPSRQHLKSEHLRKSVQAVEKALAKLRGTFDDFVKDGSIRHCKCNDPDCPVYFMTSAVAASIDFQRRDALRLFQLAYPEFEEPSSW
jgi:hypothetical protein